MSLLYSIYLIHIISTVQKAALIYVEIYILIFSILLLIAMAAYFFEGTNIFSANDTDVYKRIVKYTKYSFIVLLVCFISIFIIPSKNTMYGMLIVHEIDTKELSDTASKGLKALNIKLDEIISNTEDN